VHKLIGIGVVPEGAATKLPQPGIVLDPEVPGAMPLAGPNAGLEFGWPERFTVPVVMLYGVPADRMTIGLTVIVCGRFKVPNRKSR
jgi:hypothetical protein